MDMVPPRSTAAHAASLERRCGTRSAARARCLLRRVLIETPLVDDRAQVQKAIAVRRPAADAPGAVELPFGDLLRRYPLSPGRGRVEQTAARRPFPLGRERQP